MFHRLLQIVFRLGLHLCTATITLIITCSKFMSITMPTMFRMILVTFQFLQFGQITVLNSSNPDTNWVGVCFTSTRQVWKEFICSFSAPSMAKVLRMGWVVIARMLSERRRNSEDTYLLLLTFICGCKLTSQLFIHRALGCFQFANAYSGLCQLDLYLDTILLTPLNSKPVRFWFSQRRSHWSSVSSLHSL